MLFRSAATGTILLTPNERGVADRFLWYEVKKVAHYCLEVDAMTQPMMVRERGIDYRRSVKHANGGEVS